MSTIWAFDLGKGSIGEAVWNVGKKQFDHVASLLIPAEFASTKDAASRRRMLRTRQAHKAREAWLDEVWQAAGLEPLVGRRVGKVDAAGQWIEPKEWKKKKGTWKLQHEGDPRLEREFPARGDSTCYTSCLLRIKLLRGEKLEDWQIYKALHSAIQKRGYDKPENVPWAKKEAAKNDKTPEVLEAEEKKKLEEKDPGYAKAVTHWETFCKAAGMKDAYRYPCYYEAEKLGLWRCSPDGTEHLGREKPGGANGRLPAGSLHVDHSAQSMRKVRFDRKDTDREIIELANQAVKQECMSKLKTEFERIRNEGWIWEDEIKGEHQDWQKQHAPRLIEGTRKLLLRVLAKSFGEFLCHGPLGEPYGSNHVKDIKAKVLEHPVLDELKSKERHITPGKAWDWMGATGQKTPRFDNRILDECALIPRLSVCRAAPRPGDKTHLPASDSLLHCEVAFLMKLKNMRVLPDVRPLRAEQIRLLLEERRSALRELAFDPANLQQIKKLAAACGFKKPQWKKIGARKEFEFTPHPEHLEVSVSMEPRASLADWLKALEEKFKTVQVRKDESVSTLNADQVELLMEEKRKDLAKVCLDRDHHQYASQVAAVYAYTESAWAEVGERREFGFKPIADQEAVEPPKHSGRSRFSRPALRIMRALILSGLSPKAFHAAILAKEPSVLALLNPPGEKPLLIQPDPDMADPSLPVHERKGKAQEMQRAGLLESEVSFLLRMKKADTEADSWDNLFIPDEKLERLVEAVQAKPGEPSLHQLRTQCLAQKSCLVSERDRCRLCASEKAISDLISSQNDPIVRHRLGVYWQRLRLLEKENWQEEDGEPNYIVLEFAREDFLGKKAKDEWKKFQDSKRKRREDNRKNHQVDGREELKLQLYQDQGGECMYGKTGKEALCMYTMRGLPAPGTEGWDDLEIDHIVPVAKGGPDAFINYVLTFGEVANSDKSDMIPYDWIKRHRHDQLDAYIKFVQDKKQPKDKSKPGLSRKKIALLTRPDAADLVERYTSLAQTAWISKLAQTITRLHFGWPMDHQKGTEKVLTLTGGQTAQFRLEFRLNTLLGRDAKMGDPSQIHKHEEERVANEIQELLMVEKTKQRVDPRHHALDSMCLALIPQWRHYKAKKREYWHAKKIKRPLDEKIMDRPTEFFDECSYTPDGKSKLSNLKVRQLFENEIKKVNAQPLAFAKPQLEETTYGMTEQVIYNKDDEVLESTKIWPLDELACYQNEKTGQWSFEALDRRGKPLPAAEKLRRWLPKVKGPAKQKEALQAFLDEEPDAAKWEQFKRANAKLFPDGTVKVSLPKTEPRYFKREELRLLAYNTNKNKKDSIFKPAYAREDANEIDETKAEFASLKKWILAWLDEHPNAEHGKFKEALTEEHHRLFPGREEDKAAKKTIELKPESDDGAESPGRSKRTRRYKPLDKMGVAEEKLAFHPQRLVKRLKDICDIGVRKAIKIRFPVKGKALDGLVLPEDREKWERFCDGLQTSKNGPVVKKITLLPGAKADDTETEEEEQDTDEPEGQEAAPYSENPFKECGKIINRRGKPAGFFKADSHQGYYVYVDAEGKEQKLTVTAHQSRRAVHLQYLGVCAKIEEAEKDKIEKKESKFRRIGFLRTGCLVRITQPLGVLEKTKGENFQCYQVPSEDSLKKGAKITGYLQPGIYRLNSINVLFNTIMTRQDGAKVKGYLKYMVAAGFTADDSNLDAPSL